MTAPFFFVQGLDMYFYRPFSIVLLFFLVACNIYLRIPATPFVDSKLSPYVTRFKELCKIYKADCSKIDTFKIYLKDMSTFDLFYKIIGKEGRVIGHCYRQSREIEIRKDYFQGANSAEIEELVIHELGHCVLDLEHTEENSIDIMNPYSLYHKAYTVNYNELMNRFFSCTEFCPVVKFETNRY